MSLFAEYIKERQNKEIVENEHGFATYYFEGPYCYIEDIYVKPESRKLHMASFLADEITKIAREKNCSHLVGSVKPSTNGSTTSLKVLLGYGFSLYKSQEDFIWFKKSIVEA